MILTDGPFANPDPFVHAFSQVLREMSVHMSGNFVLAPVDVHQQSFHEPAPIAFVHVYALGIARGLHAFFRNSDIYFMANYAQTVNVIGAIKTSRTDAVFDTTGLALKLCRRRFGSVPVAVTGATGKLDLSAALTQDGKALTVGVVNPTRDTERLLFDIRPAAPAGEGTMWTLTGPDPISSNVPGKQPNVTVTESDFTLSAAGLPVPAYSVVIFRFGLR